jgi:hypothetical protein
LVQHADPALSRDAFTDSPFAENPAVGKNQCDFVVEGESAVVLRHMAPDFKRLTTVQARGIIVTSRSPDPRFIYEYDLKEGGKVRLGFPGFDKILYGKHLKKGGQTEDIPVK